MQMARFAARLREQRYSYREISRLTTQAVETGLLPAHRALSYEAVRGLVGAWQAGKRDIGDFMERARCGRPAVVDAVVTDMITDAVRRSNYGSIRQLHLRVGKEAARLGSETPSYDTVVMRC